MTLGTIITALTAFDACILLLCLIIGRFNGYTARETLRFMRDEIRRFWSVRKQ